MELAGDTLSLMYGESEVLLSGEQPFSCSVGHYGPDRVLQLTTGALHHYNRVNLDYKYKGTEPTAN